MKRPEITWSLMHPTPLDPDYVRQLTEKAKVYHVDSFEICGQCHAPSGGMDEQEKSRRVFRLRLMRPHPKLSQAWSSESMPSNV